MDSSQSKKRIKLEVTNNNEEIVCRNLGKSKAIPGIPVDILFEIFKKLEPDDLLQMARTSKNLREILMSRSAAYIWKAAFMNVPRAPKCFDGVSEPHFASLLYEKICHLCGEYRTGYVVIGMQIKACKTCIGKHFISQDHLHLGPEQLGITQYNRDCMSDAAKYAPYVKLSAAPRSRTVIRHYHKDSMIPIHDTLDFLGKHPYLNSKTPIYNSYVVMPRKDWINEKEQEAQKWISHETAYEQWNIYQDELYQAACQKRADEVIKRLINEGYDLVIKKDATERLVEHPVVKQDVALTGKIQLALRPTIIELLEVLRAELEVVERQKITKQGHNLLSEILRNYVLQCPPNTVLPPAADLHAYESFRSIIDDAPLFDELTIDNFKDAIGQLPKICQNWKQKKDLELLRLLPRMTNGGKEGPSRLLLATSIWQGKTLDSTTLFYPNVLMHGGACGVITFCQRAHDIAAEIVLLCGFDPKIATIIQMNEENPVLECLCCPIKPKRRYMTWRTAVLHGIRCESHKFAVIHGAEAYKIGSMLEERFRDVASKSSALCCALCREGVSYDELKEHNKTRHDKLDLCSGDVFINMGLGFKYDELHKIEVLYCPDVFDSSSLYYF